ncbi:hypothetical protein RKS58_23640 [Lysinibacillus capsici]|uniref:hypothetical protein n=1 Tax=Lysinibacillus capsici TaxID=2115968 RepID=UPI0028BE1ACD|nr:hypothetical protein [Lysinibacillus capsici]WNN76249.1 hypothetical protein RKS58_23640 [Lysinibacillus capsici]
MKKYVQKMWMIHDTLFLNEKDALKIEENEVRETVKAVYVGVDEGMDYDLTQVSSDFFGSWIFKTEQEALEEVNEFNQ